MKEQLWDAASNRFKTLLWFGAGVLLVSIYLAVALNSDDSLIIELLSTIGSFSLWGAADSFLIERRDIRRCMMKTAQFLTMEVAFEDE